MSSTMEQFPNVDHVLLSNGIRGYRWPVGSGRILPLNLLILVASVAVNVVERIFSTK